MVTISRNDSYIDRLRSYKIIIDDNYLDKIKADEITSIHLVPENQIIYLKIDWCRSNKVEFSILKNQTIEFEYSNTMKGWRIFYLLFM